MAEDREAQAREVVRRTLRNVEWLFTKEGNRRVLRRQMEVQDTSFLIAAAREGDDDATEILRDRHRWNRPLGMTELESFLWDWFFDGPPKAKPGPSPKDNWQKDQAIAVLVKIIHQDFAFPEYRNPEHRGSKTGHLSACLLVAQELGISERRVEEIWAKCKPGLVSPR